mmetsp:Transcript_32350/g.79020  ORF Transcript_32350/g.79020 Transcript_32350/m.79020 type:complete len:250 (+) Transcript_32350:1226-1975(+)
MHAVVDHGEILASRQLLDGFKIEAFLQEVHMVLGAVDDLHLHGDCTLTNNELSRHRQVDFRDALGDFVLGNLGGVLVHKIGDLLRRRASVLPIELDPKIFINTARVVRRREDESAEGDEPAVTRPDHRAHSGCAQQAVLSDPDLLHSVRDGHLDNGLACDLVVEPAVPPDGKGAPSHLHVGLDQRIEDTLHEVLQVVLLHKLSGLLAQARGPWLLAIERSGGDHVALGVCGKLGCHGGFCAHLQLGLQT